VAENQQSHPNAHQNKPSKTEDIVPPTHVVIDSSSATFHTKPEADENKKTSEEEPLPRFERPEWVAVYITAIYVLIAAVTLMVIWRQANIMKTQSDHMGQQVSLMKSQTLVLQESVTAIEKQVDEMKTQTAVAKTSAENALLNTKALIASERAWIVESVESPSSNQFNFVITNVGRTPANVRSVWIAPIITERGEKPEIPTDEKTRELLLGFSPYLLPPTAREVVFRFNIEDINKQVFPSAELRFYGRILYSDVLQTNDFALHETKWLYWQVPIQGALPFADSAHPEHNSYT